ncbi:MAG TPA: VCBS repeat-containing protein, partial [Planctomycetota bacterium]|nr:VCBS repeat-containing protein [Planctomycetota bacterium]
RPAASLLAALACLLASSCGAGLITGAVASNNNRQTPPPARAPELSVPETRIPLVPASGTVATSRTVVVSNLLLPSNARLSVQLRALGVAAEQGSPVIVSGQGGSTVVGFTLRLQELVAAIGDPTLNDVDGRLAVLIDGHEVAPPVPVLLLRQPVATLVPPPGQQHLFLSPLGGTPAQLLVNGLRSTRAGDLQMLVTTADPTGGTADITRPCTNLAIAGQQGDAVQITANVPGNTFPGQATLVLEDVIAGRSTAVGNAFFRPDVALALPARGPTTGGSLVTLIGSALAPLDFTVQPPRRAFDRVQLLFHKGTRDVLLAAADLRTADSTLERLVFTMPNSPDGRPGQVDIVLRVQLDAGPAGVVLAEVTAADVFLFANPQPVFGPRGALLDRPPVAAVPIALESAPDGHDAPDFAVLFDEGGTGFLQLLMAQENGMFIRFGAPRRVGDPESPNERQPRGLCAADFDGDRVPDLVCVNAGATAATHELILGQAAPSAPLGQAFRFSGDPGSQQCRAADLDGDGVQDLVLLPGAALPSGLRPQVYLARPVAGGPPNLVRIGDVPVRTGPYEAFEIADLDGDGVLDVAVLTGGAAPRVDVAYGNGDGSFTTGTQLDLLVPGYTPDPASPAVGLHVCGTTLPRSLAVVLHGVAGSANTTPLIAVLQPLQPRGYAQPAIGDLLVVPTGPVATSLGADLFADGVIELVLGSADDTNPARMGVFNWQDGHFVIGDVVDDTTGELLSISGLHFGTAFPADPRIGRAAVPAVFVVHESLVDGVRERRLSTMLVARSPTLLRPTAGGRVDNNVLQLVGGNFVRRPAATVGDTKDLALAYRKFDTSGNVVDEGVQLLANDGFGAFFGQRQGPHQPGIVHQTLAKVAPLPATPDLDALAYLTIDGRLELWQPDNSLPQSTSDLRRLSPLPQLLTSD